MIIFIIKHKMATMNSIIVHATESKSLFGMGFVIHCSILQNKHSSEREITTLNGKRPPWGTPTYD